MQQLTQFEFTPLEPAQFQLAQISAAEAMPNVLICRFIHWPKPNLIQTGLEQWLVQSGFDVQEVILGADRITWRVLLQQESFYFHYEDLSESTWFESDCFDTDKFEINEHAENSAALSFFSVWLLDYFSQKQV